MTIGPIYRYVPHHRTQEKLEHISSPVRVVDQLPRGNAASRLNSWAAVRITKAVGTMWCAYLFIVLACISLPDAVRSGNTVTLVSWLSQTFLQLVLLSVILVGQNEMATAADKRAEATYSDADAVLHEVVKLQGHLAAQDRLIQQLLAKISGNDDSW